MTNHYRVEAKVQSKDAAYILREIIEENVDCQLVAFDEVADVTPERREEK